jgi:ABC-type branched-subunit amino acid transport system ATPase component
MVPVVTDATAPATDAAVLPSLRRATDPAPVETHVAMRCVALNAWFGATHAVCDVTLDFPAHEVTAIIGPSGCGKSTLLRCLNRMHETVPLARVEGEVRFFGQDIYADGVDPIALRRHVGMVFQRPTPFPTMSIRDNVAAGLARALATRLRAHWRPHRTCSCSMSRPRRLIRSVRRRWRSSSTSCGK